MNLFRLFSRVEFDGRLRAALISGQKFLVYVAASVGVAA